ncbi:MULTISPECIES: protein translocase SEC61 complex subunit gamma [unclassified Methanothermobacter]|uniref:protein translocase SEC61 complex subunit gamma n=1 Tax=unclassified Methanothermobacter TaxID=2631116 RepID=UPI001365F7DB|nr:MULTISPECIES: protein translocase SEC61 complex subunit gamma [unclassified Methanothermobacter]MCG2827662.1 protein translocase SEC61 complex subunit gamma [Methanothermobacter sp. K4]MDI9615396.1 protein translocase SEC61 complex subunit gamma [Methanothermobacter sp.]MDI9618066.1 protein translocase SEC61 complex subunit gamma [Methanothermobacter sp.]QHN08319.1 protein translocase SEC61 complex subunit gamma [Methanothermobacter sp. THM-2]
MKYRDSVLNFIKQSKRVLKVSKKPTREEYLNVSKVTGIGIILIGVIGFIISIIAQLLGG